MSAEVADRLSGPMLGHEIDVAGVGGTLTGNALALAAIRATLSTCLRDEDFAVAVPLAERFTDGVAEVIGRHGLPWHVQRLGCRAEYWFCPPPRDGAAAAAATDEELEGFLHLWSLNRGRPADAVPQHGAVQPRTTRPPTWTGTPTSSARRSRPWSPRRPAAWPLRVPSCPRQHANVAGVTLVSIITPLARHSHARHEGRQPPQPTRSWNANVAAVKRVSLSTPRATFACPATRTARNEPTARRPAAPRDAERPRTVRSGAVLSAHSGERSASEVDHLVILVTRPAPTVRPPSRIAKRRPSSMAIGWISSTIMSVLSPGMTISRPSGRVTTPVTSVVRK